MARSGSPRSSAILLKYAVAMTLFAAPCSQTKTTLGLAVGRPACAPALTKPLTTASAEVRPARHIRFMFVLCGIITSHRYPSAAERFETPNRRERRSQSKSDLRWSPPPTLQSRDRDRYPLRPSIGLRRHGRIDRRCADDARQRFRGPGPQPSAP